MESHYKAGRSPRPSPTFPRKNPTVSASLESLQEKRKLEKTQKQVNEVINIMHENVDQIVKRGDNLDTLSRRADELQTAASTFEKTAQKIVKKKERKQTKLCVILVAISILTIGASSVLIYFLYFNGH